MLERLVGRRVGLNVQVGGGKLLYFEATILWVSGTHVCFLDRKGREYGFRLCDVAQFDVLGQS